MSEAVNISLLLPRALDGDPAALGDLLMHENDRLTRIVRFRMDPRLRGRVDAADIVQETPSKPKPTCSWRTP